MTEDLCYFFLAFFLYPFGQILDSLRDSVTAMYPQCVDILLVQRLQTVLQLSRKLPDPT